MTTVLCIKKNIYGLCCFIAIRILVPEAVRLTDSISLNTGIIFVVASIFIIKKIKNHGKIVVDNYFKVLVLFVFYSFVTLPVANYGNFSYQLGTIIKFVITDVIPALLAVCIINNRNDAKTISKVYLYAIIVSCMYGIIVYFMNYNPYLFLLLGNDGVDITWKGRVTSATFVNANSLGYFVTMSVPFVFYMKHKKIVNNRICNLAIILLLANVIMSKKKAAFVVVAFFFILWFGSRLTLKKIKVLIASVIFAIFALILINRIPFLKPLTNFLNASIFFWDSSVVKGVSGGALGSTMGMRLYQFTYPFVEIRTNPIFGHGYGWSIYYKSLYVYHPVLFGFETIIARAVCEFGLLGCIIYPLVFYRSYKYSSINNNKHFALLYVLTVVALAIATGLEYWYLFFITIIIMHKMEMFNNENKL